MLSDWIDEAIRDITGLVLDLGPPPAGLMPPRAYAHADAVAKRWQQAEANADRVMQGLPPEWPEPAPSTLEAAAYVATLNDEAASLAFIAGRPQAHLAAILKHLEGAER
jgi:hypothetical protein